MTQEVAIRVPDLGGRLRGNQEHGNGEEAESAWLCLFCTYFTP